MKGYENTIQDIAQATGLTRKYIDRCFAIMDFLEAYRKASPEGNKYYYSPGAFDVFHQIAQWKEQGMNRREIKRRLIGSGLGQPVEAVEKGREEEGSTTGTQGSHTPADAPEQHDTTAVWVEALQAANQQALDALKDTLAAKDALIAAKETQVQTLEAKLLALPDGRTPDDIAADLKEKERQERELAGLKGEMEKEQQRKQRRQELLNAFEQLPNWGKGKEKRKLLAQIRALDAES